MAYGVMGSTRNSFLSTYQTTRPVKCLYFDGASGVLSDNGTMDTQMLFLYGNITGPPGKNSSAKFLWDEYGRAERFCEWMSKEGIEGVIRMSTGFELIWCNFSSPSIRLVSRFNVSVPLLKDRTKDLPAPDWDIDWQHEPFVASQQWDWFTSASRSYHVDDLASVREPNIKLLDTNIVTLYSYRVQFTGDSIRRRSKHTVGNMRPEEVARYRQEVIQMVRGVNHISWSQLCDGIVTNFSKRLIQFQRLLSGRFGKNGLGRFVLIRERIHALIMPFYDYSNPGSLDRCKDAYLSWSLREHFVGQAIEEVLENICLILIDVGTSIERAWDQELNVDTRIWENKIEKLISWLGWAPHWMNCDRLCEWDVSYNILL